MFVPLINQNMAVLYLNTKYNFSKKHFLNFWQNNARYYEIMCGGHLMVYRLSAKEKHNAAFIQINNELKI